MIVMRILAIPFICFFAFTIFGLPIVLVGQHPLSHSLTEIDSNAFYFDIETLTRQQLNNLPFRHESQEYYGLFSGAVVQDFRGTDFLHVRGSRHDEISYTFEGIDVRSSFTGLNMMRFIPEALERITLHGSPTAGTDHAVASVQHSLRRGGGTFNFTLRGESDQFAADHETRFGTFSYGYTNFLLMAEGKVFRDNIRFFAAAERETFDDHYRKFWDGFRFGGPDFPLVDTNTEQPVQEIVGVDEIVIRPGNIPNAAASRFTLNSVITADIGSFTVGVVGLFNSENEQQNNTPILNTFDLERIPELKQNTGLLSLQTDYAGPNAWSAHFQFDILRSNEKETDPVIGDDLLSQSGNSEIIRSLRILGFPFRTSGHVLSDFTKAEENYWGYSGNVRKKIGGNIITAGGAYQRRTLRRFTIMSYQNFMYVLQSTGLTPGELDEEQLFRIREVGDVQAFGYDVFGNIIEQADGINDGPRNPVKFSLFLEDQFRTRIFKMQIGLLYESFSSDAIIYTDPANPVALFRPGNPTSGTETAPTYNYFLPRFAATFFEDNRLSFQFNFGRYVQQARFSDVYASRGHRSLSRIGGNIERDPRGFDSEPVPSTQSVFNLTYRVNSALFLKTTVFHKKITEQLVSDQIEVDPASPYIDYVILTNRGRSTARGAEFTLQFELRRLKARLNYTLSDVEGSASYPITNLQDALFPRKEKLERISQESTPLDFNQRHRGNALISYQTDKKAPAWLQNTGLHLLFRFNSGHNFKLYDGAFG